MYLQNDWLVLGAEWVRINQNIVASVRLEYVMVRLYVKNGLRIHELVLHYVDTLGWVVWEIGERVLG